LCWRDGPWDPHPTQSSFFSLINWHDPEGIHSQMDHSIEPLPLNYSGHPSAAIPTLSSMDSLIQPYYPPTGSDFSLGWLSHDNSQQGKNAFQQNDILSARVSSLEKNLEHELKYYQNVLERHHQQQSDMEVELKTRVSPLDKKLEATQHQLRCFENLLRRHHEETRSAFNLVNQRMELLSRVMTAEKATRTTLLEESEQGPRQLTRTRGGPFTCPNCAYMTDTEASFDSHPQQCAAQRPYACAQCEYRGLTKRYLKRHQNTHTVEKPFACETCGKGFKRRDTRDRHQRSCPSFPRKRGQKPQTVCVRCRQGKVKCSGTKPSCNRCFKRGMECRYVARQAQGPQIV
jgi:hypothetical protein